MTSLALRTLTADDLPVAWRLLERAFGGAANPADLDVELGLVDPDRFYGTFDAKELVGVAGSFALSMTLPGGPGPVAGVSWVGVAPTHRRQGVASALMRRQLVDVRAAGEPLAALWASEAAIYQRFGYGPAAWSVSLTIPSKAAFSRPVSATGLRLTPPDAAVLGPVFARALPQHRGWNARDANWWAYRLHDPEHRRGGATSILSVLADGADGVEGYALYATNQHWNDSLPGGAAIVHELVAVTPDAAARLWRYLLDLDLLKTVEARLCGPDDPVLHLLAEPRAARPAYKDNLWLRLVDVPAALAGRRYATDVDVVLAVEDTFCPWNAGRWRLSGGPAGATCTPTSDAAELRLTAGDLGAAYLGGSTLVARAGAGHVHELRAGALAAASLAFGWAGPAPFGPMVF